MKIMYYRLWNNNKNIQLILLVELIESHIHSEKTRTQNFPSFINL